MSDNNFNDYTFSTSVNNEDSPLSAVDQQHPLTQEALKKKDKLDALLYPASYGSQRLRRRRSISNGNIGRKLYNEDNTPMTLNIPFTKKKSDNSNATVNSYRSDNSRLSNYYSRRRSSKAIPQNSFNNVESIDGSRGRRTDNSCKATINNKTQQDGPARRFSGLVRLSANHIAMGRTRNNKKRSHQTLLYLIYSKISAIASRVINTRTSEPTGTRMSVSELISLSKYLYVLKYGSDGNDISSIDSVSTTFVKEENGTRHVSPAIRLFDDNELNENMHRNVGNETFQTNSKNTPAIMKRQISSFGNIFPFASIDKISNDSHSESESSEPTENDRLLLNTHLAANYSSTPPNTHTQKRKTIKTCINSIFKFIKNDIVRPILLKNHQQLHKSTQIRFEGWSLFFFPPTSLTRFYLWKTIGSRWFELFILFLLFCQWTLLSFVPIRFNTDQPFFTRSGDYILFAINIIYTFEAISKIIVYGFVLPTHSTSKPTFISLIQRLRGPKLYPVSLNEEESASQVIVEDTNSTYTSIQDDNLPAFASQSASSQPSYADASILSIPRSYYNDPDSNTNSAYSELVMEGESIYSERDNLNTTYSQNDDDNRSILTNAEFQVRASLAYYNNSTHSSNSEGDDGMGEFLKVNHQSYLFSVANAMDLVSIISYWIDVVMLSFYNKKPWSVFQAMAAMRLLRFLVITEGTAVIMKSLRSSYDMLKNVLGFFIFFWLLFSLVALFMFMNAFSRRCAVIPAGQPIVRDMKDLNYVEPRISCSGYMISETQRRGVFDISTGIQYNDTGGDGLYCKLGQICIQDTANQPGYGYISFENIFFAMLNILAVISTEDWTDLLYISQDSVSEIGAAVFFSFCIYLMTFIIVPMFIAVITTSFAHARGDMRESAFSSNRKAKLLLVASTSSEKKKKRKSPKNNDSDSEDEEEWTYGVGLTNMFQRRSLFHSWVYNITHAKWFPYLGSTLVTANVISMMFYSHENAASLDYVEKIFTVIFTIEIAIRIYGRTNWKVFWKKIKNRVDFAIVVATVLDEMSFIRSSRYHDYLLIFRVLRSYRISYLFPGILQLMSEVLGDGQGIMNLTFFTFLVLFLLAPISVQLFGGDFNFNNDDEPSMRFDNSYQAFLALFQIMTGENWTDVLYDAMHSQEHASVTYAALFMIFLYFSVHYLALNLFIAVIMENFDLDEEDIKQIQIKKYIREHQWKPEYFKMDRISRFLLPIFINQDKQQLDFKSLPRHLVAHVTKNRFQEFLLEGISSSQQHHQAQSPGSTRDRHLFSFFKRIEETSPRRAPSMRSFKSGHSRKSSTGSQFSGKSLRLDSSSVTFDLPDQEAETIVNKYNDEYELNVAKENKAVIVENLNVFRSMTFLKKNHKIRMFCADTVNSSAYNYAMVIMICISTMLAMWADEPNRYKHPIVNSKIIEPIQTLLLAIYWIDMFFHMITDGMFMLPKSYLRTVWNCIDVINLIAQGIFTVLNLMDQDSSLALTHEGYLRMLRTIRSLRLVYYVHGMRVIFLDLIYGLPKMMDAVALNFLVFMTFAIYGCYLFGGKFALCNDEDATSAKDCYGEFKGTDENNNDILLPRVWKNPYDYSFDTFGESLLHLFECASGEGWIDSLFSAMSVPDSDHEQPKFNWGPNSIFYSLFYVVFMFVASLCSIQLFIGVFLETFKQRSGLSSLTNTQRQYQDLQRQLALVKPTLKIERPDNQARAWFYDLVIDKRGGFAHFMAAILSLNIIVFATEHLHQPNWLGYCQNIFNSIFLSLYVFEIGAKIIGLGFYKWASAIWNIYDFAFVSMTIITSIPKYFIDELPFTWDVARKLFLVGIAFRMAQRNESLDTLFRSVKRALSSIFFVSTVFGIVIVCFGVTFQEYFSTTKFGPFGNEHANFRSLFNTVLTLFRITTGENWDFLMHDFAVLPPNCVGDEDCGSPIYALALFIVFYIVCTFIFVNLFTVIVIDNFTFTFDKRNQFTLITRTDLRKYKDAWATLDPQATGYIGIDKVSKFLRNLEGALSIRVYEKEHSLLSLLEASNRFSNNFTHFITFPLPFRRMNTNFSSNNIQQCEQYFNVYEVNRRLSNIDPNAIKERKEEYARVYQEIVNYSTQHRGIAFHKMLEILAIRLVDISSSLTFDELVSRARIQDEIYKDIAVEKAKGLVAMLMQRRKYIKLLRKSKNPSSNNSNRAKNWIPPSSPIAKSTDSSGPFIQLRRSMMVNSPLKRNNNPRGIKSEENISTKTEAPNIVIEKPSQDADQRVEFPEKETPERYIVYTNDNTFRSKNEISSSSDDNSLSEHLNNRHMSLKKSISTKSIENMDSNQDDIFDRYHTMETALEEMTKTDAKKIVSKLKCNFWSDLLNEFGPGSEG